MPFAVSGQVGEQKLASGVSTQPLRQGPLGELVASELNGRYYEQNISGRMFSAGMGTVTTIANATFTTATLGATCTPIVGLWNPLNSALNAVVSQAMLQIVITALQNTGGGPYVWAFSSGNGGLTLGNAPWNRKTLNRAGSLMKDMSGVALTGLTNNLVVAHAAALAGGNLFNIATLDTAAGFSTALVPSVENFDGSLIVPPGGVIALLASVTPVAQSAASGILWEELPIPA